MLLTHIQLHQTTTMPKAFSQRNTTTTTTPTTMRNAIRYQVYTVKEFFKYFPFEASKVIVIVLLFMLTRPWKVADTAAKRASTVLHNSYKHTYIQI